jgi:poly(ADP-ribose) glycohydrolase ARH3
VSREGVSYVEAARLLFGGEGSLGNGAAMRIGPLGLYFHDSDRLYEEAWASAEVTHAHPVGKDGAAVQALAVARTVTMEPEIPFSPEGLARGLEDSARTREIREKMALVGSLIREEVRPAAAASVLGRSVAVHESMPYAIYSFLRHPDSFEECLFCAVLNGGDRDTLGAMACAISGAYLGAAAIPQEWARKLENRSSIEALAESLLRASTMHKG